MIQTQDVQRPLPKAHSMRPQPPTAGAIRQVIELVGDLTHIMNQEVGLLRSMRVRDFGKLQDRKLELVQAYEQQTAGLRSDPSFVEAMDPRLREELKDVVSRMHETMRENELAIGAARAANEKLAKAILDAVTSTQPEGTGYSRSGARENTTAAPPVSVQIDQHL